tara:strand:+ start:19634 stop:20143 length:510 start_codon:yes stop_codon:yes gene_type:complete
MEAQSLANASLIFTEKKPLLLFAIGTFNIIAILFSGIMLTKLAMLRELNLSEVGILVFFCAWLFLRKPFSRWLYLRRIKRSTIIGKTMNIEVSRNGIIWSGEGLKTNHLAWKHIRYILEIKNGFIIPFSMVRFIWVPHTGFKSKLQIDKIKTLIVDKRVPLRTYPKLQC